MIKNYFIIALRNIKRYYVHSILNILGMAIGMACAILLLLIIQFDLSYDKFRKNADCLYRVIERHDADGKSEQSATTPGLLASTLKTEYPEIIRSSRFFTTWNNFPKGDDIIPGSISLVDKDFFQMFEIEFVQGNAKTALNGPNDIVLTEEMANRYYGNENAMGKTMTVWQNSVFTVTGVIKKLPHNTVLRNINSFMSFKSFGAKFNEDIDNWIPSNHIYTYIELKKETDGKWFEQKIKNTVQLNLKESHNEISLQNIKKIHLSSQGKYANHGELENAPTYFILEILFVFLFLLIACINFINMTTAQSSRRAKEINLRKVAGASKGKIMVQFLGEALLIVFVAHIIAMILVELMLPGLNNILWNNLAINYKSLGVYVGLIALILFCGLLAGSYPAFYLSSLKPLNIMKGIDDKSTGNAKFRRILVIFQFAMSFVFIIGTLVVKSQLNYIQNKDIGLNIHHVCSFSFKDINQERLKNDLRNHPDILGVTFTSQHPIFIQENTNDLAWEGKKEGDLPHFYILRTDDEYVKTFQPEILQGRFLSFDFSTDNHAAVINERAAQIMGFKDPVGQTLHYKGTILNIIGVLKDFNFQPLYSRIEPLIILYEPPSATYGACNVRMKPNTIPSTVKYIRTTYQSYHIDYPLGIAFLDLDYEGTYRTEHTVGIILAYATFLAILIACLGLIGLSTFMTLRRTKEIGIRKANGAKSIEIFFMLSKEYIWLVTISFLVASPIAWYGINLWLRSFAYRTNIGWLIFALAWVIVILITILTVGFQSYKAANKNPVEALRYE